MKQTFILLFILSSITAFAQPYTMEVHNGVWWQKNLLTGDSARVLTPGQINTNTTDSAGFGTKADAKVAISNVYCITCPPPQNGTLLHTISEGNVNGRTSMDSYNNGGAQGSIIQGRRGRGFANAPSNALKDDILLAVGADGYGATAFHNISLGGMSVRAATDFSNQASAPVYVVFTTTDSGSITPVQRAVLNMKGLWQWTSYGAGLLKSDATGNITSSVLTSGEIATALGYTPANAASATDTTSLSNRINAKYTTPSGSTAQYVRGDGSLSTFPTIPDTTSLSNRINAKPSYTAGTGISLAGNVVTNTAPNQTVSITQGNGISVTGTYPNFTVSLATPTFNAAPGRSLNVNFTPSASRVIYGWYTVTCTSTNPLLAGSSSANVFLEYSTNAGSSWQLLSQNSVVSTVGLAVSLQLTNGQSGTLAGVFPVNALVRLRSTTTGTASATLINQIEMYY